MSSIVSSVAFPTGSSIAANATADSPDARSSPATAVAGHLATAPAVEQDAETQLSPTTSGVKRLSRDGSGSSQQCISPERDGGHDDDSDGEAHASVPHSTSSSTGPSGAIDPLMDSTEKPLKVGRTEEVVEEGVASAGERALGPELRLAVDSPINDGNDDDDDDEEEQDLFAALPAAAAAASPRERPPPRVRSSARTAGPFPFLHVRPPLPIRRGAVTVLHSIGQLAHLVAGPTGHATGARRDGVGAALGALPLPSANSAYPALPARYTPVDVLATSSGGSSSASARATAAAALPAATGLSLHKGETAIIVLHRGRHNLHELVNCFTEFLSHMRVFALDLSALPPQDYEEEVEVEDETASVDEADDLTGTVDAAKEAESDAAKDDEGFSEGEEEESLFVAGPGAPGTQLLRRQQRHRSSLAAAPASDLSGSFVGGGGELSDQLNRVGEVVLHKVTALLHLDTILNPNFFQGPASAADAAAAAAAEAAHPAQRKEPVEPLVLPAMVVWRAGGAEAEDYSPYLPCTYSDGSSPTLSQQQQQFSAFSSTFTAAIAQSQQQQQANNNASNPNTTSSSHSHNHHTSSGGSPLNASFSRHRRYRHFGDYLRANGGPLVAKQLNNTDQIHSLSLYAPVYTVAHLYKHALETAKTAILRKFGKEQEPGFVSSFDPAFPAAVAAAAPSATATATTQQKRSDAFFHLLDREGVKSRTVMYLGASWCPPCMRIVGDMPGLIRDNFVLDKVTAQRLNAAVLAATAGPEDADSAKDHSNANHSHHHSAAPMGFLSTAANESKALDVFVKADMDLAKPIFDLLKVVVIPTFIVFDNAKLFELERRMLRERTAALTTTSATATANNTTASELFSVQGYEQAMGAAFVAGELGRLQNSQRHLINVFIEKHCTALSFDEYF